MANLAQSVMATALIMAASMLGHSWNDALVIYIKIHDFRHMCQVSHYIGEKQVGPALFLHFYGCHPFSSMADSFFQKQLCLI